MGRLGRIDRRTSIRLAGGMISQRDIQLHKNIRDWFFGYECLREFQDWKDRRTGIVIRARRKKNDSCHLVVKYWGLASNCIFVGVESDGKSYHVHGWAFGSDPGWKRFRDKRTGQEKTWIEDTDQRSLASLRNIGPAHLKKYYGKVSA